MHAEKAWNFDFSVCIIRFDTKKEFETKILKYIIHNVLFFSSKKIFQTKNESLLIMLDCLYFTDHMVLS